MVESDILPSLCLEDIPVRYVGRLGCIDALDMPTLQTRRVRRKPSWHQQRMLIDALLQPTTLAHCLIS